MQRDKAKAGFVPVPQNMFSGPRAHPLSGQFVFSASILISGGPLSEALT